MEFIKDFWPFILAVSIVIAIRVLAGQDHLLGRICRWFWNTSFKLAAFFPFCGWMTCFMIADTDQEKAVKKHYQAAGRETDEDAFGYVNNAADRQKAQLHSEEQIRLAIVQRLGRSDVSVSGNSVTIGSKTYYLEDVLKKLNLDEYL